MRKGFGLRASDSKKRINFTSGLLKKAAKHVDSLQRQLFKAIQKCSIRQIFRFQTLLKNSHYNKILSLYKVAQLNRGKKTAGVDKMKIKLTDSRQISKIMDDLARDLNREKWKPKPVRRIFIPKPDGTKRPLGIPTQYDRVVQSILTSILEVEVEHLIHSHKLGSYGFRKHHSTADAISNLAVFARQGKHAIAIEADISKCFDKISHTYINDLLKDNVIGKYVERLLKAGPIEADSALTILETEGTPQGGIISPALSNLVLRNLIDAPLAQTPKAHFGKNIQNITLTTYADDLVVTIAPKHTDTINLTEWQTKTSTKVMSWLKQQLSIAGLELKESKTRIITDEPFDFLGYQIQRGKGIKLADKTIKKLRNSLKKSLKRGRGQRRVLKEINPILRGVHNYAAKFSSGKMWRQIGKVDFDIGNRLFKLYKIYDIGQVKYADVPKTTKYISVKRGATWLDDKDYWDKRNLSGLSPRKKLLYKKQNGICLHCKRRFTLDATEILESHHILEKGKGGKDKNTNVALFHAQCHKEIHNHESNETTA